MRSRRGMLAMALVAVASIAVGCAQFAVTKEVHGHAPTGAGPFVVDVTCDPLPTTTTTVAPTSTTVAIPTHQQLVFTGTGTMTSNPLVVQPGGTCVLTEQDSGGAGFSQWTDCGVLAPTSAAADAVTTTSPPLGGECTVAADGQSATLQVNDYNPGDYIGSCVPQGETIGCPTVQVTAKVVNYFPGPAQLTIKKVLGDYKPGGLTDFAIGVRCDQGQKVVYDNTVSLAPGASKAISLEVAPSAQGKTGDDLVCVISEPNAQGGTATFACAHDSGAQCSVDATKVVFPYAVYWDAQFEPSVTPNATVTVTNTYQAPAGPTPAAIAVQVSPRFTG